MDDVRPFFLRFIVSDYGPLKSPPSFIHSFIHSSFMYHFTVLIAVSISLVAALVIPRDTPAGWPLALLEVPSLVFYIYLILSLNFSSHTPYIMFAIWHWNATRNTTQHILINVAILSWSAFYSLSYKHNVKLYN